MTPTALFGGQVRLLILVRLILRELETSVTNSKGRQRFSCRHHFDQNIVFMWTILWGLSGNFWEDWCSDKLVLPGIHRKHILSTHFTHFTLNPPPNFLKLLSPEINVYLKILIKAPKLSIAWAWFEELRRQNHATSVRDAAEETKALSVACQMTCGEASDGVRTDSKDPGSLILTWDDFKNSAIPYSFQNRWKSQTKWNQANW